MNIEITNNTNLLRESGSFLAQSGPLEYSGQIYTISPGLGNRDSGKMETAIPETETAANHRQWLLFSITL